MNRLPYLLASLILVLLVGFSTPVSARPLDVSVILDLINAGVSESSIHRYGQRNPFTFELAADDLKELKKAGASDQLIEFLQDTEEQPETAPEATTDQAPGEAGGTMEYSNEEPQTSTADYGVAYASPSVTFGFGFGYPYYYSSFYYPYYPAYYPSYYPYYYPCHYYAYYGYGSGAHGTGVYSYWYQNQRMTGPRTGTAPHSAGGTVTSPRLSYPTPGGGRSVY